MGRKQKPYEEKNELEKAEMRREYDFSGGERGKFYRLSESQRMIPLDADIIRHFQQRAQKEKKAYYVLINETLRRAIDEEKPSTNLAKVLRSVIADEVQRAVAAK